MTPHRQMTGLITRAAAALRPALAVPLVGPDGTLDLDAVRDATKTLDCLLKARRGPASAVYITWDTRGICRYVGSVHRPGACSAVRSRMREHLRQDERRAAWYVVTVFPVRVELGHEVARECEGRAARRLGPIDGTYHPTPSNDRTLDELIALGQPIKLR